MRACSKMILKGAVAAYIGGPPAVNGEATVGLACHFISVFSLNSSSPRSSSVASP